MRFSCLVAIVPEEHEEKAIRTAKEAGAGSVSIIQARGQGLEERKTFFGLTYEGAQSLLVFVLERKLSLRVLKELQRELDLGDSDGIAFTAPVDHIAGINIQELSRFEESVKEEL
jgi:hypothetical protein